MLTQIHIRDFATIEQLQLNLNQGTTMITGETGAGKSIFIEAIELALGGRASANIVRPSKEKTEISLCFDITNFPKVIDCLKNCDLYESTECIIRRVITHDGRSRCYVNGSPATLQFIKELGELLFHLHGQHEQQVLVKNETQREMLDRFGDLLPLANDVKVLAEKWKKLDEEIKSLQEKISERTHRTEYLRFQLDELQTIHLKPGEWESLEAEHRRLTYAEELMRNIQHAIQKIADDDEHNVLTILNNTRKTLETILPVEPKANEWINTINLALIQLGDLETDLKNYLENTELDPEKLQQIEERVSLVFNLSRKHKVSPHELISLEERLKNELQGLNTCDENILHFTKEKALVEEKYRLLAEKLSEERHKIAAKFEKEMTATIRTLSLPHGEFKVGLEKISMESGLSLHGNERILFLIKTNPDQSLQPIAKVISGGELSRLSLAAHLALANRTNIPTLVFDEVDTGLSGATAEKIGKLLRKLGDSYQVFCVTHQPQVAACNHHHLLVEKYFIEGTTHTRLRLLNAEEKTREIARMLGGEKITEKTLEHAKEVLQSI